jgi:hypothetical protein
MEKLYIIIISTVALLVLGIIIFFIVRNPSTPVNPVTPVTPVKLDPNYDPYVNSSANFIISGSEQTGYYIYKR